VKIVAKTDAATLALTEVEGPAVSEVERAALGDIEECMPAPLESDPQIESGLANSTESTVPPSA
jgi:hypothetical protein